MRKAIGKHCRCADASIRVGKGTQCNTLGRNRCTKRKGCDAMKRWIGLYLMVVGVLHTIVGTVLFRPTLQSLVQEGVWNTLGKIPERHLAFWYLMVGLALIVLGALVDWNEKNRTPLPVRLAVGLAVIALVGVVMMPLSPFWLLVPAAIAIAFRSRATA